MSGDGQITLRPVRDQDEEFLLVAYTSTRAEEMASVPWTVEQKEAFLRMQFAAQNQHYAAENPQANHDIVCRDGIAVGRVYVARNPDALHILDITILPQYRGAGTGSTVLRRLMEEGADTAKPVTIYVESFNPSLALFRKLGFEPVSESGFHQLLRWDRSRRS